MKKIENLNDLFIEQGHELFDIFNQEQKDLISIQKQASSRELKRVIDRQLAGVNYQVRRMEEILVKVEAGPSGEKSECCRAIFKQTRDLIKRSLDNEVRDASIISSLQMLNHYKIAGLGSMAAYARELGQHDIATFFHETLSEENAIDRELSNLAEHGINKKALTAMSYWMQSIECNQ